MLHTFGRPPQLTIDAWQSTFSASDGKPLTRTRVRSPLACNHESCSIGVPVTPAPSKALPGSSLNPAPRAVAKRTVRFPGTGVVARSLANRAQALLPDEPAQSTAPSIAVPVARRADRKWRLFTPHFAHPPNSESTTFLMSANALEAQLRATMASRPTTSHEVDAAVTGFRALVALAQLVTDTHPITGTGNSVLLAIGIPPLGVNNESNEEALRIQATRLLDNMREWYVSAARTGMIDAETQSRLKSIGQMQDGTDVSILYTPTPSEVAEGHSMWTPAHVTAGCFFFQFLMPPSTMNRVTGTDALINTLRQTQLSGTQPTSPPRIEGIRVGEGFSIPNLRVADDGIVRVRLAVDTPACRESLEAAIAESADVHVLSRTPHASVLSGAQATTIAKILSESEHTHEGSQSARGPEVLRVVFSSIQDQPQIGQRTLLFTSREAGIGLVLGLFVYIGESHYSEPTSDFLRLVPI